MKKITETASEVITKLDGLIQFLNKEFYFSTSEIEQKEDHETKLKIESLLREAQVKISNIHN